MTNNELDTRISRVLNELVPDDTFDKITATISASPQEDGDISVTVIIPKKPYRRILAAVSACVLLAGTVFGTLAYRDHNRIDTVIDIDVNPSIELAVNRRDRVLSADALNAEGEQVLSGLKLRNAALDTAAAAIIRSMAEKGYVSDASGILVTVQNNDANKTADLHRQINTGIGETLAEHDINASIVNQTLTAYDEAKRFADKHGISIGKAVFILGMVDLAPDLNADKLADYHFAALASVATQKGIDLHELVDYDDENAVWVDLEDSLQQQITQAEKKLGVTLLTPDEVKMRTGFDEEFMSKVVFVKLELAWDGDIPVYQMEFISDEAVYQYVINAIDGSWMPEESTTQPPPQTIHSTLPDGSTTVLSGGISTTTTAWLDSFIGEEKAKAFALKEREQTGCDVDNVENLTAILFYDGEKSVYHVTSIFGDVKYTHTILATNGTILKVKKTAVSTTRTAKPALPLNYIADRIALHIALKDADAYESVIQHTIYYHLHDEANEPYWRVEFCTDVARWDYRVHADSGKILQRQQTLLTVPPSGLG